ncbi:MAG: zinc ribbon domain-containing protein [Betaproteobacteria bacterium]|jgi:putative FmdB family regulatory protein|nr:MAG: zinc ribbon domain-containing protein [Betaproteobacteria bacterium]
MPIYEYRCSACGHELEVMQKMSDQPMSDCPACGKATLSKLVSAAGFQLKGSGWYVTDFRDKKKSKDDTGAGDSKASEAGSAGKKADGADTTGKGKEDSKSTDTAKSK